MARHFSSAFSTYLQTSGVITPPFTIGCWFNSTDDANAQILFFHGVNGVDGDYYALVLAGQVAGDPLRAIAVSSAVPSGGPADTGTYSINTWQHGTAKFPSTASRSAYLNGSSSTNTSTSQPLNMNTFTVGRRSVANPSAYAYMNGQIAEVAVWNIDLDNNEIAALQKYISPLLIRPSSLVYYWPIYGRFSPEVDIVGGNDLTVNGSVSGTYSHPAMTPLISPQTIIPLVSISAVDKSLQLLWDALNAVSNDLATLWNVYISVSTNKDLLWALQALANKQNTVLWDVRAAINNNVDILWNTLQSAAYSQSLLWNVYKSINKENTILWDVSQIADNSIDIVWNTLTRVNIDVDIWWTVQQAVAQQKTILWDVFAEVLTANHDVNIKWNVAQLINKQGSLLWNIQSLINKTTNILWNTHRTVAQNKQLLWNIHTSVNTDKAILWDIYKSVFNNKSLLWNVAQAAVYINAIYELVAYLQQQKNIPIYLQQTHSNMLNINQLHQIISNKKGLV